MDKEKEKGTEGKRTKVKCNWVIMHGEKDNKTNLRGTWCKKRSVNQEQLEKSRNGQSHRND